MKNINEEINMFVNIKLCGVIVILGILIMSIIKLKEYRKKKKMEKKRTPYINQPLGDVANDQIGISVYVEKIKQSINAGAEIIAIASDFGTGKSSVIALLEKQYGILQRFRYKFSTINLWGFVKPDDESIEIHRNFIYQLVSHLSAKRGSHLSKKMSKNFGVLRLGLDSPVMLGGAVCAVILLLVAEMIRRYTDETLIYIQKFIEEISKEQLLNCSALFYLLFVIILFMIVSHTDIVFSSAKSEGTREIDENIIMDYYKMQVINKGILKHYVIVIEDLDRISNPQIVVDFLKELRKYYIPEYDNRLLRRLKNKVTFIVCIKPSAQLQKELNEWKETKIDKKEDEEGVEEDFNKKDGRKIYEIDTMKIQEMYSKVFDLIIELRRINIDNYDAILFGLLEEKREYLVAKGLVKETQDISKIEGIQWIIRGNQLNIREIKQRLNDAFILYEVLTEKFGDINIKFNKCIIVSYLSNAFPNDMLKLSDDAFDKCINSYIKNERKYNEFLVGCSEQFIDIIEKLIEGRQIESDYRVYFYNYPQRSHLYNYFELQVINAILYDLLPEEGEFNLTLKMINRKIIEDALVKIHDLNVYLPRVAIKYEEILKVSLELYPELIIGYVKDVLQYTEDEIARTTSEIKGLIQFLLLDLNKNNHVVEKLINVWDENIPKKSLLEIRHMICKEYKEDVLVFQKLFEDDNPLITIKEVTLLFDNVEVVLSLINFLSSGFDETYFINICEMFAGEELSEELQKLYITSYNILDKEIVIEKLLLMLEKEDDISEKINELLFAAMEEGIYERDDYIALIENKKARSYLIDNIHRMSWCEGLSIRLCNCLYECGYYLDYILNIAVSDIDSLNLFDANVSLVLKENAEEIFTRNLGAFEEIRIKILRLGIEKQYEYLFMRPYKGIELLELKAINNTDREINLLYINTPVATMEEIIMHFNERYHNARESALIINFVYDFSTKQTFDEYFYSLDMDNIRFRKISKENRDKFIAKVKEYGLLTTADEILEFMNFVKMLLPNLELELATEIKGDSDYEKKYVELINSVDKHTNQTIKNIKNFKFVYIYNDEVDKILLREKLYKLYIYSASMKKNIFILPKDNNLLNAAKEIFIAGKWNRIVKLMCNNEEFMASMIEQQVYKKEPVTRKYFVACKQNEDMLLDLFETCNEEEIISYLREIEGFYDKQAAEKYVELIEKCPKALADNEIYDNTHHKLIDSYLKRKYTIGRKDKK